MDSWKILLFTFNKFTVPNVPKYLSSEVIHATLVQEKVMSL